MGSGMVPTTTVLGPVFHVLGPVEVVVDESQVPVPAGTQRTLLAMLLLSRGRAVSTGRLSAGLWGDEQPHDPRASLHTAVARLRRTLGGAGSALRTLAPGYVLDVSPGSLDSERFADLHAQARALLGDPTVRDPAVERALEATTLLRSALELWRGAAWGELAEGVASGDALRLEEARLVAREDLAAALLAAGQSAEAVDALESLVLENPFRDRAVGLLVDALHRYGRTADALSAYDSYRERLADELGLDPPPPLAALQQRVLRQELPTALRADTAPQVRATSRHAPAAEHDQLRGMRSREPAGLFVGRDADAAALSDLLAPGRLVTLVGPGGVGKTRLAQHVAERAGGACWVDLVPVRDRAGVVRALADALGVEAQSSRATESAVLDRLASDPGLIVLDNCEQVLDGVAAVLSSVGNPAAALLATSRERLGVLGERVRALDPLELPTPGAADAEAAAVKLFLARAVDAGVDLSGDTELVRRVGEVCRALDGLPLALELGAARMGSLTLEDLADRLDQRFELLTRGARAAPTRHRTLRSVVDWSYELLDDEERAVFTRLAVFPSGFDLAAAEAVVTDATLVQGRVADVVAQLADRSMVVRPSGAGRGKYRLLESLRQYAVSRLAPGELAAVRRRHALWVVEIAEGARRGLEGAEEARWTQLLGDVIEDLRAAWRWTREAEEPQVAERILTATWRWAYWRLRTDLLRWGAQLVAADPGRAPAVAFTAAAGCAWLEGELGEAERVAAQAFGRFGDDAPTAELAELLGDVHLARSTVIEAVESYERAERAYAERGDRVSEAIASSNKVLALAYADLAREEAVDHTLALAASTGNPSALAFARFAEGEASAEHDERRALSALDEALRLAESVGNRLVTGVAMTALVSLRGRSATVEPATYELFRRVIAHWSGTRNPALLVTALRNLVVLLGRVGRDEEAVELWAAVRGIDALHPSYGAEAERLDAALTSARSALGPSFDEAMLRGRSHLGLAGVSDFALRLCEEDAGRITAASTRVAEPTSASQAASPLQRQSTPPASAPMGPPTAGDV